jgi:hypothetical protein
MDHFNIISFLDWCVSLKFPDQNFKHVSDLPSRDERHVQVVLHYHNNTLFIYAVQFIYFYLALQPNAGYGLLIHEVFEITYTARHSR